MIEVYGTEGCLYCKLAKEYLEARNIDHIYIDVAHDTEAMKMFRENNFKTVPQIFLDNTHIGGYDDMRQFLKEKA